MRQSITIISLIIALVAMPAFAQDYLIKNGRVVTLSPAGVIASGDVLVRDGKIAGVGDEINATDVAVIDAEGAWVTPGFFDSSAQLGLGEVTSSSVTTDQRVLDTDLGAGFQVGLALDRFSQTIRVARVEGVTRALVTPTAASKIFAGQGAIIDLSGQRDFIVNDSNAVFVQMGESSRKFSGGSRAKSLMDLIDALREADNYRDNRRAIENAKYRDLRESSIDLEALVPVLERKKPLAIYVDRASEIEMVLNYLNEFDLDIVIMGGREAWKVSGLLADLGIPVVLNPADNIPRNFDRAGIRLDNAALLVKAGVMVAFMTGDIANELRTLTQSAGIAVAYGLAWEEAVKAITVNPARIWGLDDRYGSLAVGRDADVVIWNGDPLEVMSAPTTMLIKGQLVDLTNRQTELRDRYRDLSKFQ